MGSELTALSFPPYLLRKPKNPTPLIVDSPHSGRIYPTDFNYTCPLSLLQHAEDYCVDELITGACDAGATLLLAQFPRTYIDVNRAENDIDPHVLNAPWPAPLVTSLHTLQGLGLVRRMCRSRVPVYAAPLSIDTVQQRIRDYYRPYHATLDTCVENNSRRFGVSYLINAHSMPDAEDRLGKRPDFVLGDRCGTSCDQPLTRHVSELLQDLGYSVALNDPYKGMEIVRRYGAPSQGRHALQLEINRRLYMDEERLEKHAGFLRLQRDLTLFFQRFVNEIALETPTQLAAE